MTGQKQVFTGTVRILYGHIGMPGTIKITVIRLLTFYSSYIRKAIFIFLSARNTDEKYLISAKL